MAKKSKKVETPQITEMPEPQVIEAPKIAEIPKPKVVETPKIAKRFEFKSSFIRR